MWSIPTTRSIVTHRSSCLHINRYYKSQSSISNPMRYSEISRQKIRSSFLANRGQRARSNSNRKMDFVVYSSVPPGNPLPSGPPPTSWKNWILGLLATAILPFLGYKWGPLLKLTEQIESAVQIAEDVTETIEKVAEEVEKVAEDIIDDLPGDGKFKRAIAFIENAAEETAKAAHFVDDVIDKAQEVGKDVESFFKPDTDQANEIVKEANDQK